VYLYLSFAPGTVPLLSHISSHNSYGKTSLNLTPCIGSLRPVGGSVCFTQQDLTLAITGHMLYGAAAAGAASQPIINCAVYFSCTVHLLSSIQLVDEPKDQHHCDEGIQHREPTPVLSLSTPVLCSQLLMWQEKCEHGFGKLHFSSPSSPRDIGVRSLQLHSKNESSDVLCEVTRANTKLAAEVLLGSMERFSIFQLFQCSHTAVISPVSCFQQEKKSSAKLTVHYLPAPNGRQLAKKVEHFAAVEADISLKEVLETKTELKGK
ncbi:Transcription and mRNA export factor ENY2-2, partial [Nibea albiflora]